MEEELEELDEDLCEIYTETKFDLGWTCPNCKTDNVEYNVNEGDSLKCKCENCGKKYGYYVSIY